MISLTHAFQIALATSLVTWSMEVEFIMYSDSALHPGSFSMNAERADASTTITVLPHGSL